MTPAGSDLSDYYQML